VNEALDRPEEIDGVKAPDPSISFVIASVHDASRVTSLLQILKSVAAPDDEIVVLLQPEYAATLAEHPPGLRVVAVPDA